MKRRLVLSLFFLFSHFASTSYASQELNKINMNPYFDKLQKLKAEKDIRSPKENLALFVATVFRLNFLQNLARDFASEVVGKKDSEAGNAVKEYAESSPWNNAMHRARTAIHQKMIATVRWSEKDRQFKNAVRKAVRTSVNTIRDFQKLPSRDLGIAAYKAGVDGALRLLNEDTMFPILESDYLRFLDLIPDLVENHPFGNSLSWLEFKHKSFGTEILEERVFQKLYTGIFQTFASQDQALSVLASKHDPKSPLYGLLPEILDIIVVYLARIED